MNELNIPNFKGSKTWVYDFMSRHKLVFRKPHYARRAAIDPEIVNDYLHSLDAAITYYGHKRVLNMDETQVLLNNYPSYTIALVGQESVTIEKKFLDEKAGTTYIGTISNDPSVRFPLYCIAKGKTNRCEEKYENTNTNDCQMDHAEEGWCTQFVMIRYLTWLYALMGNEPFALVLDIYRAHITDDVSKFAEDHGIKLIYVPANGTGQYQPLDRRIFGIIKKQLEEKDEDEDEDEDDVESLTRSEKFKSVHHKLIKIWKGLSNDAINSAWEIPGSDEEQWLRNEIVDYE